MSKSNAHEEAYLRLVFNQTNFAGIANAAGGATLFVALHTADPGEAGDQTTSEATFTGYARVSTARTTSGWTVTGSTVQNAAQIQFPTCTGGSETITHWSVGLASSGASLMLYKSALSSTLAVSNNIAPAFAPGQVTTTED